MAFKVIISVFIACQLSLLPALAQTQFSSLQSDRADQVLVNQKAYSETRSQFRLNNQPLHFPKNREPADIGIAKKIGVGIAAAALFAVVYSLLLWFILQSCLLVFVPKKNKRPAST